MVEALQRSLQELELMDYPDAAGYFGVSTRNALMSFQRIKGIDANGVADDIESWESNSTPIVLPPDPSYNGYICLDNPNVVHHIDVAFPVVHGTNVEDGTLQGYFQSFGIPDAGCDVPSSALGMDKFASKAVLKMCGLPGLDCVRVHANEFTLDGDKIIDSIEAQTYPPMIEITKEILSLGKK